MKKYKYVLGMIFEVEANSQEEADELARTKDKSELSFELTSI